MIRIELTTGPFSSARLGLPTYFTIGDKTPAQCFDAIIALHSGWTVDYSEATDEEYAKWMQSDILCRMVKAGLEKRPVIYHDRVIQNEDVVSGLIELIEEHDGLPVIIEDGPDGLVLGAPAEDEGEETEPPPHR